MYKVSIIKYYFDGEQCSIFRKFLDIDDAYCYLDDYLDAISDGEYLILNDVEELEVNIYFNDVRIYGNYYRNLKESEANQHEVHWNSCL